jgi:hypothetical protein
MHALGHAWYANLVARHLSDFGESHTPLQIKGPAPNNTMWLNVTFSHNVYDRPVGAAEKADYEKSVNCS